MTVTVNYVNDHQTAVTLEQELDHHHTDKMSYSVVGKMNA